jgi:hypothetical protein
MSDAGLIVGIVALAVVVVGIAARIGESQGRRR